jgi:RHS repeat-associated protein
LSSVKDRTLGYTGKPYDAATGMYNYGYRDYKPQAARFTTVDPVRDGNNWYAYDIDEILDYNKIKREEVYKK